MKFVTGVEPIGSPLNARRVETKKYEHLVTYFEYRSGVSGNVVQSSIQSSLISCAVRLVLRHSFFNMAQQPLGGPRPPHYRGFTITLRHVALGRTPHDE